eukprot:TRINITY_DN14689_c0_g3_i2.p2 TRINITY_DN14689_c0_g3~~TRINITY_DN14689_c0_g3_i2.p2  ORF type:complete len:133 (+),score=7.29 TRINITY_DN14689_c0_g3_i2:714-1112(+)
MSIWHAINTSVRTKCVQMKPVDAYMAWLVNALHHSPTLSSMCQVRLPTIDEHCDQQPFDASWTFSLKIAKIFHVRPWDSQHRDWVSASRNSLSVDKGHCLGVLIDSHLRASFPTSARLCLTVVVTCYCRCCC